MVLVRGLLLKVVGGTGGMVPEQRPLTCKLEIFNPAPGQYIDLNIGNGGPIHRTGVVQPSPGRRVDTLIGQLQIFDIVSHVLPGLPDVVDFFTAL